MQYAQTVQGFLLVTRGKDNQMSNRIIAVLAAAAIVIMAVLAADKDIYGEKEKAMDIRTSLEEAVHDITGEDLDEIEEELDLYRTEYDYSEDVHEAGTINYDYLKKSPCENSSLPRIDIRLDDDYLLSKEYSKCSVSLTGAGDNNISPSSAQVRLRGNWSSKFEKKPLKIKFDSKVSMFGRDPERSWTLIANYMDNSQLHNYISYDLYSFLTPPNQFVPLYVYVDVYINDVYIGLYALSDQIETGKGRVAISRRHDSVPYRNDYLIEQDFRLAKQESEGENVYWFWSRYNDIMFSVKSPEEGLGEQDLDYMRNYMDLVYVLAKLDRYEEVEKLIDVDAFISYMMVQDIIRNADIFKASIFYVKPAGGRLAPATIWDCDLTFGGLGGYPDGTVLEKNYLYEALMGMPEFRQRYIDTFFEKKDDIKERVLSEIDRVSELYYEEFSNEYFNWEITNTDFMIPEMNGLDSYADQIDMMKWWFETQMINLEDQYSQMY